MSIFLENNSTYKWDTLPPQIQIELADCKAQYASGVHFDPQLLANILAPFQRQLKNLDAAIQEYTVGSPVTELPGCRFAFPEKKQLTAEEQEAKKLKRRAYDQSRYANRTPAQIAQRKESDREARANMTPEQKAQRNESGREAYANRTPAQIAQRKESDREAYANGSASKAQKSTGE